MPGAHNFEHLPLLLRYQGKARLRGGGDPSPQTLANKGARRQEHSVALDTAAHTVRLDDGSVLPYDRIVLAPGVSFDDAYGLTQADYDTRTPHAWRGGAQTTLLAGQVAAIKKRFGKKTA